MTISESRSDSGTHFREHSLSRLPKICTILRDSESLGEMSALIESTIRQSNILELFISDLPLKRKRGSNIWKRCEIKAVRKKYEYFFKNIKILIG